MPLKTTLNMKKDIYDKIIETARMLGTTRSFLIITALKKIMKNDRIYGDLRNLVLYQKSNGSEHFKRFHICFSVEEYNYFTDMRKFYRMSVSLLAAVAIDKYLNKIIRELLSKNKQFSDNYLPKNYVFIQEDIDNVISWRIYWGYPTGLPQIIQNMDNNTLQFK